MAQNYITVVLFNDHLIKRNTMEIKKFDENDEEQPVSGRKEPGADQGQPKFNTGSTTQGGSNFGQGSSQLGNTSYKQGSKKSDGSNYENEEDFETEK